MTLLDDASPAPADPRRERLLRLLERLATSWAAHQSARAELERQRESLQGKFVDLRELIADASNVPDPRVTVLPVRVHPRREVTVESEREAERLHDLHVAYAETRHPGMRAQLVEAYDAFAAGIARSFSTRRESPDDLAQVARLGLLLAVDRFDPSRGRPFKVFARATITGELKRHVRDQTWAVHVGRSAQERFLVTVRAVDDLTQELGRSPRIPEVAGETGLSEEQVLEAMELGERHTPRSLDAPAGEDGQGHLDPGTPEDEFDRIERDDMLGWLMARLSDREREVIRLRFVDELSQAEIAARMGTNQMKVSRLLAHVLRRMRVLAGDGP